MGKIVIDPFTRIEGHLKIEATVEGGEIKDAKSSGKLFRGFEMFMRDREPTDALHLTQRICGVCPTSHATTAALNLDSAFGIAGRIPKNGRIVRNLIQGSNYIQSCLIHFYHLVALDYVDITNVLGYDGNDPGLILVRDFAQRAVDANDLSRLGPFYPRYEGDYRLPKEIDRAAVSHYVQALDMRRLATEMLSIFGGRWPHFVSIVPGGATREPTVDNIGLFLSKLTQLRDFIDNVYLQDVLAVAGVYSDYFGIGAGSGNHMSYGVFDIEDGVADLTQRDRLLKQGTTSLTDLTHHPLDPASITEDVKHGWYSSGSGLNPSRGQTEPNPNKSGAYSWLKSPRYKGDVYEAGPLSRMLVSYVAGEPTVQKLVNDTLAHFGAGPAALFSVLGRHAARALECKFIADSMAKWALELKVGEPMLADYTKPDNAEGMGLWEAPRGALGHWISIENGKIKNYQVITPSNWNCSPADDKDQPGPVEQALIGAKVKDEENPFEVIRIVRSFDPCLACSVHMVRHNGETLGKFRIS
jgi:hydrogenase large subunit